MHAGSPLSGLQGHRARLCSVIPLRHHCISSSHHQPFKLISAKPQARNARDQRPAGRFVVKAEASAGSSIAAPQANTSTSKDWETFQKNASGEWEGITATFNAQGEALELPERFVPSAYREWEVYLFDWQSLCSMQVLGEEGLQYSLKRMMPTVGCEADAVAFTEEAQRGLSAEEASRSGSTDWPAGLPWTADGSYALVPHEITAEESKVRLETCLVRPKTGPLDAQQRTRLVHHLKRQSETGEWQIDTVEVHHERFLAPYNGGAELAGCGGGMSAFAQKRPDSEKLAEAARRTGDGCGAVHLVREQSGGFARKSGNFSIERLLSAASEEGLVLANSVVTSVDSPDSNSNSNGAPGLKLSIAVLHERREESIESVSAAVVSYLDGSLQEVSFASQFL